jgi:hypothetical protein
MGIDGNPASRIPYLGSRSTVRDRRYRKRNPRHPRSNSDGQRPPLQDFENFPPIEPI